MRAPPSDSPQAMSRRTSAPTTENGDLPPEPTFAERVRVMCRHLDLMIEVFGEEPGCRMFRKVAPWYAKRFGPCHEFNKRVVQVSTRAEFHDVLENYIRWRQQFLDANGELQPRFRPPPLVASFMRESNQRQLNANKFPCPKGRWRCGKIVAPRVQDRALQPFLEGLLTP